MALFDRDDAGGIILIRRIMCGRDNYKIENQDRFTRNLSLGSNHS